MKKTLEERFWSKVDIKGKTDCWIWKAGKSNGYGMIKVDGKMIYAHRVSWMLHNGNEPGELNILHRCDTPLCVNPYHLFNGTINDNMQDKVKKGRQSISNRRLTIDDAIQIRDILALPNRPSYEFIAKQYNVSHMTIWKIGKQISYNK